MRKVYTYLIVLIILGLAGSVAGAQGYGDSPWMAYVAFYEGGIQIFDVSDPWNPENIGDIDTNRNQALDVVVVDNYAYVADMYGGLQIYDVSDPSDVGEAIDFFRPCKARALSISGDYIYVAASDSLQIFDITEPAEAFWITTYEIDLKADQDIEVVDDYAYVACGVGGLKILDVSVPEDTYEIGHIAPPGMARNLAIDAGYAYIASDSAGLQVLNIMDPANPVVVGEGIETNGAAWGVVVEGNYAYVADRNYGLYIIDITNPEALTEVGKFHINRGRPSSVAVKGGFAFVAAHQGDMWTIDVSDPTDPKEVHWLRWPGNARAIFLTG